MIRKLILPQLTVLLTALIACSNGSRIDKAEKKGENDALHFIEMANSKKTKEIMLHDFLLNVRNNENMMIRAGYTKEAQVYVDAFEKTIAENDSAVYKRVFFND